MSLLSNHIVGNHKFVLIVDDAGIERSSESLLKKLLAEQNTKFEFFRGIFEFSSKTSVVLPAISKLELDHDESSIAAIIQELKISKNVSQIFAWATTKNINSRLLVPFLEHMSSVVVSIKSEKILSVLVKRKFGSVKVKVYQHELSQGKTSIKEFKVVEHTTSLIESAVPESIESTFKIGEFNATELEAKKNLKLPFEIIELPHEGSTTKKEGKIIYAHDKEDDFDEEEDPDNDLIF